jgi:hypothetical protein
MKQTARHLFPSSHGALGRSSSHEQVPELESGVIRYEWVNGQLLAHEVEPTSEFDMVLPLTRYTEDDEDPTEPCGPPTQRSRVEL